MLFFRLQPARPFDIWTHSIVDTSGPKGVIKDLVFVYDMWSPDPLFKDTGYVFVTDSVAKRMGAAPFTGFELVKVTTRKSETLDVSAMPREPETVWWLRVTGVAGVDDFGFQSGTNLVVSERILDLLRQHGLTECKVFDHEPNYTGPRSMEELLDKLDGPAKR